MTDDPIKRLEQQGQASVPPMDPGFADRLESHLRVEHGALVPGRRRVAGLVPRLALGIVVVLAGVVGAVALTGRQAGVPVTVIDDPLPPATQPDDGGTGGDEPFALADPTPTPPVAQPTATPTSQATPTTTVVSSQDPPNATVVPTPPAESPPATSTTVPEATSTSAPTVVPSPTSIPTPTVAVATPIPVPTATASPTPSATATPTPTPTPDIQVADIEVACEPRVTGDAVGAVCNWRAPQVDVPLTSYEVVRSKNGGDAEIVARQRAGAARTYADRDLTFGDEAIYLIRGLAGDQLVATSVRQVVTIPDGDS